jgi:PilZ domain
MASPAMRRSDRVSLTLLLEASGKDSFGKDFKAPTRTLLINRGGAVIVLDRELSAEQQVHLRRQAANESHREADVRVVGQFGREKDGYLYGVEILDASKDLWGVEFPPLPGSEEAVARMLLECSYCRSREVAYLNELDLRGFEINRGIARHCRSCGVPSIWTQAPHENEKRLSTRSRGNRGHDGKEGLPESGEKRGRTRMRLKTRLTACVRQAGTDDELAVCEDISPIGMCFRSKRRYDSQSLIQVAVPYSPDAANIFLPARIIYSEEMPKAGLFRHGTEYSKVGPRAR